VWVESLDQRDTGVAASTEFRVSTIMWGRGGIIKPKTGPFASKLLQLFDLIKGCRVVRFWEIDLTDGIFLAERMTRGGSR
jgi:hypothetical protein